MVSIDIEYCVPCNKLGRAQDIQENVLSTYGLQLDAVTLLPGDNGVFQIRANGDVIYDKEEEKYDEAVIVQRVGDYL